MAQSTYPPIKGQPFDLYFRIPMADGSFDTTLTGLACRVVVDGRGYAGPTPRVVDAATGSCVANLAGVLTNGATLLFSATSATNGSLPYAEKIATAAQTLDGMAARERRRKGGGWR
jgi:hypothetical protein